VKIKGLVKIIHILTNVWSLIVHIVCSDLLQAYMEAEAQREQIIEPIRTAVIEERGTILMQTTGHTEIETANLGNSVLQVPSPPNIAGIEDPLPECDGEDPISEGPISEHTGLPASECNEQDTDLFSDPLSPDETEETTRKRKSTLSRKHIITLPGIIL
jgi:hypothetical protein